MTHMYGSRRSFRVLRPKITIELLTQSAEKWSCMGKWAVPCGAILFLRLQKGPRCSDFSTDLACYQCGSWKRLSKKALRGAKKKIPSQKFSIFAKITINQPLTPTFGLGQTSIASPILFCWWQTMARWNRLTNESCFGPFSRGQTQLRK